MEALGMLAIVAGFILMLVGGIWLLVVAFTESMVWGFLCLCISPAAIVFVILYWRVAKMPFLLNLAGAVIYLIGFAMLGEPLPA